MLPNFISFLPGLTWLYLVFSWYNWLGAGLIDSRVVALWNRISSADLKRSSGSVDRSGRRFLFVSPPPAVPRRRESSGPYRSVIGFDCYFFLFFWLFLSFFFLSPLFFFVVVAELLTGLRFAGFFAFRVPRRFDAVRRFRHFLFLFKSFKKLSLLRSDSSTFLFFFNQSNVESFSTAVNPRESAVLSRK